jgi:hypothetical protein
MRSIEERTAKGNRKFAFASATDHDSPPRLPFAPGGKLPALNLHPPDDLPG